MATKSIPQQIYDEFISAISKEKSIGKELAGSIKHLLNSDKIKKNDIVELLNEEVQENEDS